MKTQRNLFWGLTLITLGVLFLARNWNLFPMPDWRFVRGLWPVLFILGGVALMLRRSDTSPLSVVATAILAVALPFWLFSYTGRHHNDRHGRDRSMRFNMPIPPIPPTPPTPPVPPTEPGMDMDLDTDDDENSANGNLKSGTFTEDMPTPAPAEARFVLEGGAASFRMGETTSRLIDAQTKAFNLYTMSIDRSATQLPTVRLSPVKGDKGNVNIFDNDDDSDNSNFGKVVVKLNESPLWDMQMDFGAGAADFDLSRYAVKSLKIEAGAAALDLRLGDRATQSDVKISSGMAAVKIRVPKSAGVKITTDGGLNATDIDDDFERVGNNTYLSPNYNASVKKITIRYDGGLSSLNVSRY